MDPCLKQHQSGATDLISLGKVFSFPPAEEKTLVEVAEKAGTLTICMDFLEDWCKLLILSHACLWCCNLLCVFLMFFLPPNFQNLPGKKIQDSQPENQPNNIKQSFRGASPRGEVWGCRWQQGIVLLIWKWCVWVALGKRICWVRFVVFFFGFFSVEMFEDSERRFYLNISVGKGGGDSKPCNCRRVFRGFWKV